MAHYGHVLLRGWWIILLTTLCSTGAAVALSLQQQHLYSASAQVFLSNQNLAASLSNIVVPSSDPARVAQTQADLARVPTVAERTVAAVGLRRTADNFLAHSSVSASSNADLLTFSVTDRSSLLASELATAYARQYTLYRRQLDTAALTRARRQISRQLALLEGQGKTGSTLHDSLLEKDQQLATLQALQASNAAVVRNAGDASQVQPQTRRNGLLGFVLGLLLGIGLAFVREARDTRVRSVEELQEGLGLPLLARLPEPPRNVRKADGLVMLDGPQSREAEAFRILAVSLEFANRERGARTIMLTSALAGEGKSTTAANLAVALARSGRRVSLVDLDLRSPYLHRFFDLQGKPGITQVVNGTARLSEALARIPLPDLGSHEASAGGNGSGRGLLEVLPSGPSPQSAGEFAHSSALAHILGELAERAELVLVDAPPLLGVGDAVAISGLLDALVVVSRASLLRAPVVNELRRVLSSCPAPVIGLIATGAEPSGEYAYSGYSPPLGKFTRDRERAT